MSRPKNDLPTVLPVSKAKAQLQELQAQDMRKAEVASKWFKKLTAVRKRYGTLVEGYRKELHGVLQTVRVIYDEIEASGKEREEFYAAITHELKNKGYKIQRNAKKSGLILRWVFDDNPVSASNLNHYATAIEYSKEKDVPATEFAAWLRKYTLRGAVDSARSSNKDKPERLQRSKILLLQYLDWREHHPMLSFTVPVKKALAHATKKNGFVLMIGFARQQGANNAHISVSHMLPPSLRLDIDLINRWASYIEPNIDVYEAEHEGVLGEKIFDKIEDVLIEGDVMRATTSIPKVYKRK